MVEVVFWCGFGTITFLFVVSNLACSYSVVALGGSLTVDNVPADQLRSAETSDAECHRSCDQRGLMPTASSMKKRRRHMIINDIPDDTVVGHPNKTAEAKLAGFRSPEVVQARCGFPNTGYTAHNGFEGAPASPNAVKGHARVLPLAPDLLPAAAALIGKRVTAESFPEASRRSLEQLQHYQKIIERLFVLGSSYYFAAAAAVVVAQFQAYI